MVSSRTKNNNVFYNDSFTYSTFKTGIKGNKFLLANFLMLQKKLYSILISKDSFYSLVQFQGELGIKIRTFSDPAKLHPMLFVDLSMNYIFYSK